MFLQSLRLKNFRAFEKIETTFHPGINLITGENGSGKTTLLEAIYYLALTKSFREHQDRFSIGTTQNYFDVQGHFKKEKHSFSLRLFYSQEEGKKAFYNNNKVNQFSEIIGMIPVVILSLDDMDILYGYSSARRKWLDIFLSQLNFQYLNYLKNYKRTLSQKNKLLSVKNVNYDEVESWNIQLAEYGAQLIKLRAGLIEAFNKKIKKIYVNISGKEEQVSIEYHTVKKISDCADTKKMSAEIHDMLRENFENEKDRGLTFIGPHRDDILFMKDNLPIKKYGSVGENKTFLIALKILEQLKIKEKKEVSPFLLLDDIFGELDNKRVHNFFDLVENDSQTFITTTNFHRMSEMLSLNFHHYNINDGEILYEKTLC